MTLLALIRHGPTAWNDTGLAQGHTDVPLGDAGRAAVAGWRVPDTLSGFDWVVSPLQRARETAEILYGRAVETDARLIEMNWGAWEGRNIAELRAELGAELATNEARGLDFETPAGDSPRRVRARLQPFLADIAGRGRPTVAVTHLGVIRAIMALAAGWDMTGKPPVRLKRAAAHLFRLSGDGMPAIEQMNVELIGTDPAP